MSNIQKQEVTDSLGTYVTSTHNSLPTDKSDAVYVNIFDNTSNPNASDYKITLALAIGSEDGKTRFLDFVCPTRNRYFRSSFLESVPKQHHENPFYKQVTDAVELLRSDVTVEYDIEPTAGFFREKNKTQNSKKGKMKSIPNAVAILFKERGENPQVILRFSTFYWQGELEENDIHDDSKPSYTAILKAKPSKDETFEDDFDNYF